MRKDSVVKTFVVAILLCMVCSVIVSGLAVGLKPKQDANKLLDIKKNILLASGMLKNTKASEEEINGAFKSIKARVVDLETGEYADNENPEEYSEYAVRKSAEKGKAISKEDDVAKIKRRGKKAVVYQVMDGEAVDLIILPVRGVGLWSELFGFLALENDTTTIEGIGFYLHGETPGLGAEIENPRWKKLWAGKKALDIDYKPAFQVIKGSVNSDSEDAKYEVDGLSGATITCNGVTGLMQYWMGDDGFGPYLAKFRASHNKS